MGSTGESSSYDMATALELPLGAENEAKFLALKNLQLKKIKQLMASLDLKDREIAKLKVTSKDNRRTQMIQALRNKIKDLELVNDVIKEELSRKGEMSLEKVNEVIMLKTLGGPKRFRPLTREELENKIYELEKKVNKKPPSAPSHEPGSQAAESKHSEGDMAAQAKSSTRGPSSRYEAEKVGQGAGLVDAAALLEELQRLRSEIRGREIAADKQRDEISRLRSRNAELVASEEEISYFEQEVSGLQEKNDLLSRNLQDVSKQLAEALEIASKYRSEAAIAAEHDRLEVVNLQAECEKLLKQNSSLLQSLAEAEATLQRHGEERGKAKEANDLAESSALSKDSKIKALEGKLARAEEKVRQLEEKCTALETEAVQVAALKNQLREKNIQIKEMQRNQQEKERIANKRAAGKGEEGGGRNNEEKEVSRPSDDKEEK